MITVLARYRAALAQRGMGRMVSATFIAYLLAGTVNLALLLAAESVTGSYAAAGVVAGSYSVALAVAAPLWGRVVDRLGPRRPLAWTVALQLLAFSSFVVVAATVAHPASLAVIAFAAGACTPPSSSVARRVMMTVRDEQVQRTLFAISGFFAECVFVVGPLLIALVLVFVSPTYAVVVAAVASASGGLLLRGSPPVRALEAARDRAEGVGKRAASWNARQVRVLVVIAFGAFAIGAVQVGVVAHAEELGTSAGVLVAALAVGGVVASFLYGGLSVRGSLPTQLVASLGLYGVLILTLTGQPGFLVTVLLLFLVGAATGPADAIEALLLGRHTPPAVQAQAFAVLVTANWIGFALGSAVGGRLVQDVATSAAFVVAGVSALVATVLVLTPVGGRLRDIERA